MYLQHLVPKARGINVSVLKPWNVLPFSKVKTTRTFIYLMLINSLDHNWGFWTDAQKITFGFFVKIKLRTKTRQRLSETFCILGFEPQNAARQLSLRQHCPNVVRLCVNFSSAPHWAVQETLHLQRLQITQLVTSDGVAVLLPMLSLLVFVFFKTISYLCIFFWIHEFSGWRRSSRIGNWWLLLRALGSKKWPNNRLDHITAAMCQLLWIFHCLRIDFQCDVD